MFKTLYAVCSDSGIDGGAPGYFAIAMCETREDAEEIKKDIDEYLNKIQSNQQAALEFKYGYGSYRYDLFDYLDSRRLTFGYHEGIDSKEVYIVEVKVVLPNKGKGYIPYMIEKAEEKERQINSK